MKVQKIKLKNEIQPHWLVIGEDYLPIEPIDNYLFFLRSINKSPYTIRTYAHHLKIFWEYLSLNKLDWQKIDINKLASFVSTLSGLTGGNIIHLVSTQPKRSARTINQIMVAVINFYQYQLRLGKVDELLVYNWKKVFPSSKVFKPLLHHLSKSKKQGASIFKLKEKKNLAKTVETSVIKSMVSGCKHLRDQLLICLLYETGCRIGQALGLRHEDIETFNNVIIINPREDNINNARAKTLEQNRVHVSKELMQLYCDYYLTEYGDVKSDYVFVNLWQGEIGKPMSYNAVMTLFQRLSNKQNVHVTPHMLRHSHATELIRAGWGMAAVQKRLGHRDIQTTMNTYIHLTEHDMKEQHQKFIEALKKRDHHRC